MMAPNLFVNPIFAETGVKVKGSRKFLTANPQRLFKRCLLFLYIYPKEYIIFRSQLPYLGAQSSLKHRKKNHLRRFLMTTAINQAAAPTFFETVRQAGSTGVTWLKTHSTNVANSVSAAASKVANAVLKFFTETCPKYFNLAKAAFIALPVNAKYGIGAGVALAVGYGVYTRFFSEKTAPAAATSTTAVAATEVPAATTAVEAPTAE